MPVSVSVEKYAQLNGHRGAVYAISKADIDRHVFTAGSDGTIARWDIENNVSSGALAQVNAPVFSLMYDDETRLLWVGREDGGLHVIDTQAKKEIKLLKNHTKGLFSITKNGDTVYTSGGDGTVACIDAKALRTAQVFKVSDKKMRHLLFSKERQILYTASADGMIRLFPVAHPQPFLEWHAHDDGANIMAEWSGNSIITGGRDARLKIWQIDGDKISLLENIPAHNYAIYRIKIYREPGIFITCSRDKTIKIWDMQTLQVLKRIERVHHGGHKNSVNDFMFLPESKKIISVSDDASIIIWNLTLNT